ncbi:Phosphoserine phosphatase 1 [subsurface metagenome]
MSRLFLVRHGNTELNSAERYWGRSDVKLSAAGIGQAERLRDRLVVEKIDAVYSSDLERALVTAEIIASSHQLAVITCAELCEVNFGQLEGLNFSEISRLYPEVAKLWAERSTKLKYPGGESLVEFNNRVSKFLSRLDKHAVDETILVVAHAGVLRTLVCQLLGIDLRRRWQIRLDLASLSILETHQQGAILSLLNDVSHLT